MTNDTDWTSVSDNLEAKHDGGRYVDVRSKGTPETRLFMAKAGMIRVLALNTEQNPPEGWVHLVGDLKARRLEGTVEVGMKSGGSTVRISEDEALTLLEMFPQWTKLPTIEGGPWTPAVENLKDHVEAPAIDREKLEELIAWWGSVGSGRVDRRNAGIFHANELFLLDRMGDLLKLAHESFTVKETLALTHRCHERMCAFLGELGAPEDPEDIADWVDDTKPKLALKVGDDAVGEVEFKHGAARPGDGGSLTLEAGRSAGPDAPEPASIRLCPNGDILVNGEKAANNSEVVAGLVEFCATATITLQPDGAPSKFSIPAHGGRPELLVEAIANGDHPRLEQNVSGVELTSFDDEQPLDFDGSPVPSRILLTDAQFRALCDARGLR